MPVAITFKTVSDAFRECAKQMSLTSGEGINPYSEDLIVSYLDSTHKLVIDEKEWAETIKWYQRTLDGVQGLVTTSIPNCDDWKNIRRIYQDSFQTPLPLLTTYANPLNSTLQLGYLPLEPDDDLQPPATGRYLVRFYPLTNTGTVLFQIQQEYDFSNPDLIIPIDFWLHVYGACMQWAGSDDAAPNELAKFTKLYNKRLTQMVAKENSRPSFNQPNQLIPNDWWEQDAPYA